jgi:hypothetical protein
VTRFRLCLVLATLTLLLGLATAAVQSHNRAEGDRLDAMREECLLIEAVNGASAEKIIELDQGPLDHEVHDPRASKELR